ncbi:MAG: zinc carboxypeptidase, partial [Balneolaceae bacterium]|nr:zinc carboxypeptidase [Balneolaceae bacterium]
AREADRSEVKGYVFGTLDDRMRSYHLAELLSRHNIEVYKLGQNLTVDGTTYAGGNAYVVPAAQTQYRLVEAMFERRTSFQDSLFYDVSAWTMPYAFNLPFAELDSRQYSSGLLGERFNIGEKPMGSVIGGKSNYGYLFEWDEYYAPRALYRLLKEGVLAKVASEPFTALTALGTRQFDHGTILIPTGPQSVDGNRIYQLLQQAADSDGLNIYSVGTGLTPEGIDLGSGSFETLRLPKVALIGGDGTSSYEVGEAWHLMDQRYDMEVTLLTKDRLRYADIGRYNVIVMTSGRYNDLSDNTVEKLKRWVRGGGTILGYKYAIRWLKSKGLADIEFVEEEESPNREVTRPYTSRSRYRGAQAIGGTIFFADLDLTHPMGYGFSSDRITVFRNSTLFMKKAENPYATPLRYTDSPLASGYASEENLDQLSGSAAVVVSGVGGGKVISMTDNPNFRAYWYGTNKLFANAVFFGHTISGSASN